MPTEKITVTFTDVDTATVILDNTESVVVTYTDVETITVTVSWEA